MLLGEELDVFAIGFERCFIRLPQGQRRSICRALEFDWLKIRFSSLPRVQSQAGLTTGHGKINICQNTRVEQGPVQASLAVIDIVTFA